jgi:hypothetical protein
MSSWVTCPCGHRIGTGAFPNVGVHRLISEEAYDDVVDPIDRPRLSRLFLGGREVIECAQCTRLLVRQAEEGEYRAYLPEPAVDGSTAGAVLPGP